MGGKGSRNPYEIEADQIWNGEDGFTRKILSFRLGTVEFQTMSITGWGSSCEMTQSAFQYWLGDSKAKLAPRKDA